jgi:hypothetical protein
MHIAIMLNAIMLSVMEPIPELRMNKAPDGRLQLTILQRLQFVQKALVKWRNGHMNFLFHLLHLAFDKHTSHTC